MYALVYKGNIVVGPRDWKPVFFTRWLEDNLNITGLILKESQVPLIINQDVKLLKVIELNVPPINNKIQQLGGPYWTINATSITGEYTAVNKELDQVKIELKNIVAAKRYEKEVGGVDVGGIIVKTDPESQAKLTGAWARVQQKQNVLIDWKGSNGWVKLNKNAIEGLADAIGEHVQLCFSTEKEKCDTIDACTTLEELDAVNLEF